VDAESDVGEHAVAVDLDQQRHVRARQDRRRSEAHARGERRDCEAQRLERRR
jgi:hypothetical protein